MKSNMPAWIRRTRALASRASSFQCRHRGHAAHDERCGLLPRHTILTIMHHVCKHIVAAQNGSECRKMPHVGRLWILDAGRAECTGLRLVPSLRRAGCRPGLRQRRRSQDVEIHWVAAATARLAGVQSSTLYMAARSAPWLCPGLATTDAACIPHRRTKGRTGDHASHPMFEHGAPGAPQRAQARRCLRIPQRSDGLEAQLEALGPSACSDAGRSATRLRRRRRRAAELHDLLDVVRHVRHVGAHLRGVTRQLRLQFPVFFVPACR